jgi:hypothetical protein
MYAQLTVAQLWELAIFALRENILFATDISILRLSRKSKETMNHPAMNNKRKDMRNSVVAPMIDLNSLGGGGGLGGEEVPSALSLGIKEEFPELILVINLVRAFDLTKVRKFGKNNSYVTVSWGDQEVGRSGVVLNSLSPKFDDQIGNYYWSHR